MLDQIAKYRQIVTLADGTRVLFRPLVKEDKAALIALFEPIGPDDQKLMRNDVRDRELVGAWADNVDYKRVLPLVAVVNDRIVGDTTLHFAADRDATSPICASFCRKNSAGAGWARRCCAR